MSSHREAPEISKDPAADSADLYAFVSPDKPDTVTIIANYVPLQGPAGGPNFYEFGDDVLYQIDIDNDGDGISDIIYQFQFQTSVANPETFLYNTGPIGSLTDAHWNRRQTYRVAKFQRHGGRIVGSNLVCPPCNIGPLSTPNYESLATAAIGKLADGESVFAGQRADGFYVDLGSIFDLGDLRPFEQAHNKFGMNVPQLNQPAPGINGTKGLNVHSIALQIPKALLTKSGVFPTDPGSRSSVIGVWTSAYRQKVRMLGQANGAPTYAGPWVQVSRLGNPLINEVIIPLGDKDGWNAVGPGTDSQFAHYYTKPELAGLLPVLYPGAFPNLDALNKSGKPRVDLVAVLLTGIPPGIVPGFQNSMGTTQADMLRLNMAIPPTTSTPSNIGLLGGDAAGFPNGRRVFDDVTTIELRAIAGVTYALVDKTYKPDAVATAVHQGLTSGPNDLHAEGTAQYLGSFPYLGQPYAGWDVPADDTPTMVSSY
ncbi:MAG TPA: DUF4331 domain-containing protein [Acidimicrobiales bacterium]|nr:DUF4331 domain-containing protein [Acidimicrobiales bacterium]